jgi:endo-1,3(4)-beta-glucanase
MEYKWIDNILPSKSGYSTIDDSTHVQVPKRINSFNIESNDDRISYAMDRNKRIRHFAMVGIVLSLIIFIFTFYPFTGTATNHQMGSILERSIPFKQVLHPETPTGLWGSVSKPYPTGAFWTNLVVKNGDGPIGLSPYGVKAIESGVQISYGATRRVVTQLSITDPFNIDLQLSASQPYVSRAVESYDNSSVTMTYKTNNGGKYKAPFVKGSPFVTVVYDNTTPVISSDIMTILDVEPKMIKGADGVQFIVTLGNFQRWLVVCSENIIFSWRENSLTASGPIRGYVRVAILPSIGYLEAYKALIPYTKRYPTGAVWTINYISSSLAEVNVQYTAAGTGPLLMYASPHHTAIMSLPNVKSDDAVTLQRALNPIYSIKGKLKAVVGEQWKLVYNLVSVGWHYVPNDKLTNSQMDQIAKQLIIDVTEQLQVASDPYGFGKQIGRMARLALIADEFGIPTVRSQAIQNLENSLTPWLAGSNPNALLYDKTWGGLVPTHGLESFTNEFGSGWYSDHHFHYGYFVYALAALAMLDPPYWAANRPAIESIVRDICNPDPTDADFPYFRHKDFFEGHSWASGLFQQGNGKGQESSSEVSTNPWLPA